MVDEVEFEFVVEFFCDKKNTDLPKDIVNSRSSVLFFPKHQPVRKVKIDPVNTADTFILQLPFNAISIVRTGDDPDIVVAGNLLDPVPSHSRLRTFARLTSVGGDEYIQP